MAYLNKVFLMGNLTRDPELSYTPQGVPVCKFGLAVNRTFKTASGEQKDDPLFVDITVWRKQAENCAQYLKKGRSALVEGTLKLETWQSKTGEKRSKIKVVAQSVKFIGGGRPDSGEAKASPRLNDAVGQAAEKEPVTEETPPEHEETEEDIPF